MPCFYGSRKTVISSPLHLLDPRVKLVFLVLWVLTVNLVPGHRWPGFLGLFVFLLAASHFAHLGVFFCLKRSLVALPFVLAAVAIPFVTPGREVALVPLLGWSVTSEGLARFIITLARFFLAVQAAILVVAVTPPADLLWALRALRLPGVLVSVIGLMHRYIYVIGEEAHRMRRARLARSPAGIGRNPGLVWRGRVTGQMIGSLFHRSLGRSERIYRAMLSRGYDGHPRSTISFQLKRTDWVVLLASFFLSGAVLLWGIS